MSSEIKVDTISENTSANGVAIDSLIIKDQKITNHTGMIAQCEQQQYETFTQIASSSTYTDTGVTDTITPSSNIHNSNGTSLEANPYIAFLDSPSTTSAVTYKVQMHGTSSAIFRINNFNTNSGEAYSSMTLLEVL